MTNSVTACIWQPKDIQLNKIKSYIATIITIMPKKVKLFLDNDRSCSSNVINQLYDTHKAECEEIEKQIWWKNVRITWTIKVKSSSSSDECGDPWENRGQSTRGGPDPLDHGQNSPWHRAGKDSNQHPRNWIVRFILSKIENPSSARERSSKILGSSLNKDPYRGLVDARREMPIFKEVRKRGKFVYFDYRPRYSKIFLHQRDVAWISVTSTKYFPIASHCPPLLHRQLPLLTLPLHSVLPLRISQHCGHHSQETPRLPGFSRCDNPPKRQRAGDPEPRRKSDSRRFVAS